MVAPLKVGIAGLGTVGAEVVRLIETQARVLASRSGRGIRVVAVTSSSGTTTTLVPSKSLSTLYNVSLTSSSDSIRFDMRGYASPRLSATGMFKVLIGSRRDSVCVTTAGQVMPRSCSL